jgi:hypothetical protein
LFIHGIIRSKGNFYFLANIKVTFIIHERYFYINKIE